MRNRKIKNINRVLVDSAVSDFANELGPEISILDVGAGSGKYRDLFQKQTYLAIDRGYESGSLKGLDLGGDIMNMPFLDNSFDAAICVEVMEHLPETEGFLRELHRVVAQGGSVLLTTPMCFGEHMAPWDFYRFTRFALEKKLSDAGFKVLSINARGGYFTLLAYLMARFPDEFLRDRKGWWPRKIIKPLLRLMTTYSAAPLLAKLDFLDKNKNFTLGYVCRMKKN